NLPLFWAVDTDADGIPERKELRVLQFYPQTDSIAADIDKARDAVMAFDPGAVRGSPPPDEVTRRKLVAADLDQGALSLIYTDLRGASDVEKPLVRHMLAAGKAMDDLYMTVTGAKALANRVAGDDFASQSLFRRDWGPKCAGAKTPKDSPCYAIPG